MDWKGLRFQSSSSWGTREHAHLELGENALDNFLHPTLQVTEASAGGTTTGPNPTSHHPECSGIEGFMERTAMQAPISDMVRSLVVTRALKHCLESE